MSTELSAPLNKTEKPKEEGAAEDDDNPETRFLSPFYKKLYNLTHSLIFQGLMVFLMALDFTFILVGFFTPKTDIVCLATTGLFAIELTIRVTAEWLFYFEKLKYLKIGEIVCISIWFILEFVEYNVANKVLRFLRISRWFKYYAHQAAVREARQRMLEALATGKEFAAKAVAIIKSKISDAPERVDHPPPVTPPQPKEETLNEDEIEKKKLEREELAKKKAAEEAEAKRKQYLMQQQLLREREGKMKREREQREAEKRRQQEVFARQQSAEEARRTAELQTSRQTKKQKVAIWRKNLLDDISTEEEDHDMEGGASVELQPTMQGEKTMLFDELKCYKIVDPTSGKWGFFNATEQHDFHVKWSFGPSSTIQTLGRTTVTTDPATGWYICELTVHPGETQEFISGQPNGWKASFSASGMSPEYKQKIAQEKAVKIQREIDAIKSQMGGGQLQDEVILSMCLKNRMPFVDLSFPPAPSSLSRPRIDNPIDPVPFQRPPEYLNPGLKPRLYKNRIEPNDIDQGQLGDCWFLCAIASVAEFPDQIKECFRHPILGKQGRALLRQEQSIGAYRVSVNKHGWWHNVILDNYLPAISQPVFAKNVQEPNELWVALLEKAYAKLHGSFSSLVAGDALQALQDLTGCPTMRFSDNDWTKESANLFQRVLRADQQGYLININTPGQDDSAYMGKHGASNSQDFTKRYKKAGLGMGHAYSVLKAVSIPGGPNLVQIRNPWGNGTEWTGKWGDDDRSWQDYPNVAKACNFSPGEDGTFWMSWDDVRQYFDSGGICYLQNGWVDYRMEGKFFHSIPSLALEISVSGGESVEAFVVLSQKDRRGLDKADPNRQYEGLLISLIKPCNDGSSRYTLDCHSTSDPEHPSDSMCFSRARDVAMKYNFQPSSQPYYIVPRVYGSAVNKDFVLGLVTESEVCDPGFTVKFKTIPSDNCLFKNHVEFDLGNLQNFSTNFQSTMKKCAPKTSMGTCLTSRMELELL